jgi:hypothetical protein
MHVVIPAKNPATVTKLFLGASLHRIMQTIASNAKKMPSVWWLIPGQVPPYEVATRRRDGSTRYELQIRQVRK